MTTKKFNAFEYSGRDAPGADGMERLCRQEAFDTPNGYAFVLVSDADSDPGRARLTAVAMERIRYYLENEVEENPGRAPANSLIYTSGYLFQMHQKQPSANRGQMSALCALLINDQLHYAWVGDPCLFLFTGRKVIPLTRQEAAPEEAGDNDSPLRAPGHMGHQALITPGSPSGPLQPLNGDMVLMGTAGICAELCRKGTRALLRDSMPAQTKVARMIKSRRPLPEDAGAALGIICFNDVSNTIRSYASGSYRPGPVGPGNPGQQPPMTAKKKKGAKLPSVSSSAIRNVLTIAALLLVAYMVYDLFIYNPRPPRRISPPTSTAQEEMGVVSPPGEEMADVPALPADSFYTVRSGDTWGRLYVRFGVCSWFVINHPPNRGRFGRESTLLAGQTLAIPLRYSGNSRLNPVYHTYFGIGEVGSSCQNAGRELLEAFERSLESP